MFPDGFKVLRDMFVVQFLKDKVQEPCVFGVYIKLKKYTNLFHLFDR